MMKSSLLTTASALASALMFASAISVGVTAQATTLRVPSQYPTIQAAVNAASFNGDLILVAPGTYRENVTVIPIGPQLRIESEQGPDRTVIDGGGVDTVVKLGASGLYGFTVTNGVTTADGGGVRGGTVVGCVITGNSGARGGGYGGAGSVMRCVLSNNTATAEGGGVFLRSGQVLDCVVHGNTAGTKGGGVFVENAYAALNGNTIAHNRANGDGGGVSLDRGDVINTILWGNVAAGRGQQAWANKQTLAISTCIIDGGASGAERDPAAQLVLQSPILSSDPLFAGPGDYHITAGSPAFQAGDSTAIPPSATDIDGQGRPALGRVDIGADEFAPHLYKIGSDTAGSTLVIRAIAPPSAPVYWALSGSTALSPTPTPIPGLGLFHLIGPLGFVPLGRANGNGIASFSIRVPSGLTTQYPSQALLGYVLSEPLWVP